MVTEAVVGLGAGGDVAVAAGSDPPQASATAAIAIAASVIAMIRVIGNSLMHSP